MAPNYLMTLLMRHCLLRRKTELVGWVEPLRNPSHAAISWMGFASTFTTLGFGRRGRSTHPRWTTMTEDLTGVWDGTYIQPQVGMVTFLVTLIESGRALTGNVTEPCMTSGCPVSTHNASIAGHRSGSAVSFVKHYEPPGYGYDKVFYEGAVNADATEISGRWRLPGAALSGSFLMVRSSKTAESAVIEEQAKEPVR
jgi:hypothetical protein